MSVFRWSFILCFLSRVLNIIETGESRCWKCGRKKNVIRRGRSNASRRSVRNVSACYTIKKRRIYTPFKKALRFSGESIEYRRADKSSSARRRELPKSCLHAVDAWKGWKYPYKPDEPEKCATKTVCTRCPRKHRIYLTISPNLEIISSWKKKWNKFNRLKKVSPPLLK